MRFLKKKIKNLILFVLIRFIKILATLRGPVLAEKKLIFDAVITLDLTKKTQLIQYLKPIYEPHILKLSKLYLRSGESAVDIGAHIGYWTLCFSKQVGGKGRVLSVEPEPDNFNALKSNINNNHLTNVIAINCALSSEKSSIYLKRTPQNEGGHHVVSSSDDSTIEVPCNPLSELVIANGFLNVEFVKVDVEGHELEVLDGAFTFISESKPRCLVFECSKAEIKKRNFLISRLSNIGYKNVDVTILPKIEVIGASEGGEDLVFLNLEKCTDIK